MKDTIKRIDRVLEATFIKNMQKVFEAYPICLKLTVDAKIQNLIEAYKCLSRCS
jgi:hypothetical protein